MEVLEAYETPVDLFETGWYQGHSAPNDSWRDSPDVPGESWHYSDGDRPDASSTDLKKFLIWSISVITLVEWKIFRKCKKIEIKHIPDSFFIENHMTGEYIIKLSHDIYVSPTFRLI